MGCFFENYSGAPPTSTLPSWGVNIDAHGGSLVPLNFADATNAGLLCARHSFKLTEIAPTSSTRSWGKHDNVVNSAQTAGVRLVGMIGSRPSWTGSGSNTSPPPNNQQVWDLYTEVVTRYVGKVECWQVWNEPEINGWTAAQYKTFLIGAAAAIRAADPGALVGGVIMSKSPVKESGAVVSFAQTLLSDSVVRDTIDILCYHTYCRPGSPETGNATNGSLDDAMKNTKTWLADLGFSKPVWITEFGWPTEDAGGGVNVSEADQGRYIIRTLIMYRGILAQRAYIYRMYSKNAAPWTANLDSEGILFGSGAHKLAYDYVTVLNRVIGPECSILESTSDPVWVYRFDRTNGTYGYALWRNSGTSTYTLVNLPASVKRTTISGVETTLPTTDGSLDVSVSGDPVYIETFP